MSTTAFRRGVAVFAVLFGAMSVWQGGAVALGLGSARAAMGDYVPGIVWFNALAGVLYAAVGLGLWGQRRWVLPLALLIALSTALAFGVLGILVVQGQPFETRTIWAMTFRLAVWLGIAGYLWRQRSTGSPRPQLSTPPAP